MFKDSQFSRDNKVLFLTIEPHREQDFVAQLVKIERELNVVIFLGWCDLRPDVSEEKISRIRGR